MPRFATKILRPALTALVLGLAWPAGGAEGEKPPTLVGATREQVYARLGEPRSMIKAGAREIMFFAKVKVTLRNNLVVETEELFDDSSPPRRAADPVAAGTPDGAAPAAATAASAPGSANDTGAKPGAAPIGEPRSPSAESSGGLEIKFVRPPASKSPRPASPPSPPAVNSTVPPVRETTAPAPAPLPASGGPKRVMIATAPPPTVEVAPRTGPPAPKPGAVAKSDSIVKAAPVASATVGPALSEVPTTPAVEAVAAPTEAAPVAKRPVRRRLTAEGGLPTVTFVTKETIFFAFVLAGAVGYLVWRRRQRQLELAVTTVSRTPFSETPVDNTALFTAGMLAKLEWKRFEELVGSYYSKTGVVAVRTKTGPESPVHLQISWKGEKKPFACVQCHSNPDGLIRLPPLQALAEAISAADIRRGYVITNGKFSVDARDFAEEKHFTLLPGDLLLEKLNALPPAARAELMNETIAGDFATPSCPKCEAKMGRAEEGGWRCAKDGTEYPPKKS